MIDGRIGAVVRAGTQTWCEAFGFWFGGHVTQLCASPGFRMVSPVQAGGGKPLWQTPASLSTLPDGQVWHWPPTTC